jgi:hypothetical protein
MASMATFARFLMPILPVLVVGTTAVLAEKPEKQGQYGIAIVQKIAHFVTLVRLACDARRRWTNGYHASGTHQARLKG